MRTVYLIRHGKAAPKGGQIRRDADRPLTAEGIAETARMAQAFWRLACPSLILTSPLVRALQTAEIFAGGGEHGRHGRGGGSLAGTATVRSVEELGPIQDFDAVLELVNAVWDEPARGKSERGHSRFIDGHGGGEVALVGHEPDMGLLASFLLTGGSNLRIEFKKAAVCRIDVESRFSPRAGTLVWLISPKVVRPVDE